MKVLIIVAGTNEPSNSNALADAFIQGMEQLEGVQTNKLRLKDLRIEHFTLDFYEPVCHQEEDFCRYQKLMEECDGFVIASPIWNFSVPGHLKNLIDRSGSFALDASRSRGTLGGKPFYTIFTGGTPLPAWQLLKRTTSGLQEAWRYFGASPMGIHFEPKCTKGRGTFGLVVDERPESLAALRRKGYTFAKVVETFKRTGKAPLKQRVIGKTMKWGEAVLKKIS